MAINLSLDKPVIVAQATPEVTGWGPYQFPRLERLADGSLHVAYHIQADSAVAYGLPPGHAISRDEGQSWDAIDEPASPGGLLLPDGDRLLAASDRSLPVGEIDLPKPIASIHTSYVDCQYYRAGDLARQLTRAWPFMRLPKGSSAWSKEWATVEVGENADVRTVTEGVFVIPFFEQDRIRIAPDGTLRATLYGLPHLGPRGQVLRPYLVRVLNSADGGRTWREVSTIPYRPDPEADPVWDARDGFTEPELHDLPDGSQFCLLRTTDGMGTGPMYWTRSEDGGVTWSCPRVYDRLGVWPQLLTLASGVTLAAYGRPGLFVRATADPSGLRWEKPIAVIDPGVAFPGTCSYSDLIILDKERALIVYSDFSHPNPQGQPCKTILSRSIKLG